MDSAGLGWILMASFFILFALLKAQLIQTIPGYYYNHSYGYASLIDTLINLQWMVETSTVQAFQPIVFLQKG